jgi:hypothetical protein
MTKGSKHKTRLGDSGQFLCKTDDQSDNMALTNNKRWKSMHMYKQSKAKGKKPDKGT